MDYTVLSTLFTIILMLGGCNSNGVAADRVVDTTGVTTVEINGDASTIHLSSNETQALSAAMRAKPDGWLSGWFYKDCKPSGDMVVSGNKLIIKTQNSNWSDVGDCVTDLQINLPRNSDITIDQPAFKADLQGQFANVSMNTRAADIALQGTARSIKIRGDAFRTQLRFEDEIKPERIDIAGRALDTSISFPSGTKISYQILSKASLLDTQLPNTTGAATEIVISGDYARTEIK